MVRHGSNYYRRRLISAGVSLVIVAAVWLYGQYVSRQSPALTLQVPTGTAAANPQTQAGLVPVSRVIDGDTIEVRLDGKATRVRLIGVDTPEVVDPRKPVQCFGEQASAYTKQLLTGKMVRLASDPTQGNTDKYGRLLRYVFLPDGTNVDLTLIAQGYGHEYTYDIPYQYQAAFKQAEAEARNNNRGLWSPATCSGNTSQ